MRRQAIAATLALLLGGCAQNAIFELHVDLPALYTMTPPPMVRVAPDGARFARVQVLPGSALFREVRLQWLTPAIPLETGEIATMITVPADGDEIRAGLHVKVQLCSDEDCSTPIDERWYSFERVFYQGHYTCYERDFAGDIADATMSTPAAESDAIAIDRCEVTGCVSGNELSLHNCTTDGRHFCEAGGPVSAQACDLIRDRDTQHL